MRTWEDVELWFELAFTPAQDEYSASVVRGEFLEAARTVWDHVPDGPDKTLVLRRLWDAAVLASATFALEKPI